MTQTAQEPATGIRPLAGLFLLCLLAALAAARPELLPATVPICVLPPLEHQAILAALLALAALPWAVRQRPGPAASPSSSLPRLSTRLLPALLALGWLILPILAAASSSQSLSAYTRAALLLLAPLFTAIFAPHFGSNADLTALAWPASLVAAASAWLLFPVELPATWPTALGFFLSILTAAAIGAANCLAGRAAASPARLALNAATLAAVILGLFSLLCEHPILPQFAELAWMAALELPPLLLLFAFTRRLAPIRLATRAILIPLFIVLLGLAAFHPFMEPRQILGLLALAASAAVLLFARPTMPQPPGLHLNR